MVLKGFEPSFIALPPSLASYGFGPGRLILLFMPVFRDSLDELVGLAVNKEARFEIFVTDLEFFKLFTPDFSA